MDFSSIVNSVASLGVLGFIFGAGLAYASEKFKVEVDPRVELIIEALPGANCGACGYPGCQGFANAVVAGEAPTNGCPVGRAKCADALKAIMAGGEPAAAEPKAEEKPKKPPVKKEAADKKTAEKKPEAKKPEEKKEEVKKTEENKEEVK